MYTVVTIKCNQAYPELALDEALHLFERDAKWQTYVEYDKYESAYKAYFRGSVPLPYYYDNIAIENVFGQLLLTGAHLECTPNKITSDQSVLEDIYKNWGPEIFEQIYAEIWGYDPSEGREIDKETDTINYLLASSEDPCDVSLL